MAEETKYITAYVRRLYHPTEKSMDQGYELCVQELSDQSDGSTMHQHEDFIISEAELRVLQQSINGLLP